MRGANVGDKIGFGKKRLDTEWRIAFLKLCVYDSELAQNYSYFLTRRGRVRRWNAKVRV